MGNSIIYPKRECPVKVSILGNCHQACGTQGGSVQATPSPQKLFGNENGGLVRTGSLELATRPGRESGGATEEQLQRNGDWRGGRRCEA